MIGIVFLGIWMLLVVYDLWSIKKRLDKLEWIDEKKSESEDKSLSSGLEKNSKKLEKGTTKNNLGVDCIVDVLGSYTDLDIPYKREIAENILTKLPSVTPQEPRWIPISKRLPRKYSFVLVSTDANEVFIADYLGKMSDGTDCFDDDDGMMWEGDVIAWMPMPEPYIEVEE